VYPGVELRLYRYVVVLAEELNFTRAALRLHVAQPSLSKQIRELEGFLGAQLFDRTKRDVRLTLVGEAFEAEARLTLLHAGRAIEGARAAKGQIGGPWNLGYSPLIDLRVLSKVRQHLSLSHPAAEVRFVSAFTSEQAEGLMRGTLQAGLVLSPLRQPGLTCEGLYREPLVLALPEGHALMNKPVIGLTDLHELPLVTIRRDIEPRFGEDLNRVFAVAHIRRNTFHEATTYAEALELVSENGVASLTLPWVQGPEREGIVFRSFADEFLTAETGLVYSGDDGSAILKSLRSRLFEMFQPLGTNRTGDSRDGQRCQMNLF